MEFEVMILRFIHKIKYKEQSGQLYNTEFYKKKKERDREREGKMLAPNQYQNPWDNLQKRKHR